MSLQYKVADQVLTVYDDSEPTSNIVNKYDAFLNLLCTGKYSFQREAVQNVLRFLVSQKYPNTERLAIENFNLNERLRKRYADKDEFLGRLPLRDRKSVSVDLATGTGKSYVIYGLAAIALAEGLAEKVLVLCPSLTIEDGLRAKFDSLIGNSELTAIMKELGAIVATPGLKTGNDTVERGDICVENIHAVYERTGTSIYDSFKDQGGRVLVLNDEAHHIFSKADKAIKKWLEFLQKPEYGFSHIVNFTGTPYVENEYFADVVYRYGLKQAIEDKIVKKPNYKEEETKKKKGFQETYKIHTRNTEQYKDQLRPITIVVTQSIATCVEVWNDLVKFLLKKERVSREEAEKKCIWVTSGIPGSKKDKERVEAIVEKPEKRRQQNLRLLKEVDKPENAVEWIVSVSMLTEGWDVKNVFQIVPHETRAFNSKLLIAQVLGRGLRVPPGVDAQPLVTINNHENWSDDIQNLLREILEIENQLSWGYLADRSKYAFPLFNLKYEPQQTTTEVKYKKASEANVIFQPQSKVTAETSRFSETGTLTTDIENEDLVPLDVAVGQMKIYLNEKDEQVSSKWSKKRIRVFIETKLLELGYESGYLSKTNLLLLQQGFGPMFRSTEEEHPRLSQKPDSLFEVDLAGVARQYFSESALKKHGKVYYTTGSETGFVHEELVLWQQYQKFKEVANELGTDGMSEDAQTIVQRLEPVEAAKMKTPWNIHVANYTPEQDFSNLLFEHSDLFDAFIKMPDKGVYSFPYSYKPARKTHVTNENFNPDFFLKVAGRPEVLVVEVKSDEDKDETKNKAKHRDGKRHFEALTQKLRDQNQPWKYHFFFLSPADFTDFFQRIKDNNYAGWQSTLMQYLAR